MTWVSVMHWWSVWDLWLTPPFIHSVGEGAALGPADRWGSEKVRDVPEMSQLFRVDGNTLQLCFQYLFLDLATYIGRFFVPLEHCSESFTCINLLNPHYKSVGRIWYNHPHFTSREAETGVRKLPKVMLPGRNGAGIYRSPGSGPCSLDGYVTPSFCTLHVQAIWLPEGLSKQMSLALVLQLHLQGGEHGRGRGWASLLCCQHPAALLSPHHLEELCYCPCGVLSPVLKALMVWVACVAPVSMQE